MLVQKCWKNIPYIFNAGLAFLNRPQKNCQYSLGGNFLKWNSQPVNDPTPLMDEEKY